MITILILGLLLSHFAFYVWGSLVMFADYKNGENGFTLALMFCFGLMAAEQIWDMSLVTLTTVNYLIFIPKIFVLLSILYLLYVNKIQAPRSTNDGLQKDKEPTK